MKISYVISYEPTKFSAVGQGNWKEIGKIMAGFGYEGIELAIKNPFNIDVAELKSYFNRLHLELVAIGTGQVYFDGGCSLISPEIEKRKKAFNFLEEYIKLASVFDAKVIIGLIRGRLSDHTSKYKALILWGKNFLKISKTAKRAGVELIIEPINRYETDYFNTVRETADFIESNNLNNTGILFDTFHSNIEECSFEGSLKYASNLIKHVHIADSNRNFPGSGHIDFKKIFQVLFKNKYSGYFSGEMRPIPDLITSIKNYITYMNKFKINENLVHLEMHNK